MTERNGVMFLTGTLPALVLFLLLPFPVQRPEASVIEQRLLARLNEERARHGLVPVRVSLPLQALARAHSQEMSKRGEPDSFPSNVEIFRQKLRDENLFFVKIGENVAFSDSYDDGWIMESLMASSNKDNILDPDFDLTGIGVAYGETSGVYITQSFIQSLELRECAEVEGDLRRMINDWRKNRNEEPFAFSTEAEETAREYSRALALGERLPTVGDVFGETLIYTITTPLPLQIPRLEEKVGGHEFGDAGLGVWFGRSPDYPGGAYFLTLFIFPNTQFSSMRNQDLAEAVLVEINLRRKRKGLRPVTADKTLSQVASRMSELLKRSGRDDPEFAGQISSKIFYNQFRQYRVVTFITDNPCLWPGAIVSRVEEPPVRKVGIGVSSQTISETRRAAFWISMIIRDRD